MFIPEELRALPRWVCCYNTSKVPMQARERRAASSVNPATWSSYEEAQHAVDIGIYDYLGFVFAGDGIVGIDIDAGFTDEGFLSSLSVDCMNACKSFTEYSRSGRGIHIYLKGTLPFKGKNNGAGLEMYSTGRYFIVTGKKLIFSAIVENQDAIDYLVERYFADVEKETENTSTGQRIYKPTYADVENGVISLSPSYPEIKPGMRNISLTSLGGQLRTAGYTKQQIYSELLKANQAACKPPLSVSEVESIVNSISKYRR